MQPVKHPFQEIDFQELYFNTPILLSRRIAEFETEPPSQRSMWRHLPQKQKVLLGFKLQPVLGAVLEACRWAGGV